MARDSTGAPALPQGFAPAGDIYAITPHGTRFTRPVEVRLPMPGVTLQPNQRLYMAKAEPGGPWEIDVGSVFENGVLRSEVTSFSFFTGIIVTVPVETASFSPFRESVTLDCAPQDCQALKGRATIRISWSFSGALNNSCVLTDANTRVTVRTNDPSAPEEVFMGTSGSLTRSLDLPPTGAFDVRLIIDRIVSGFVTCGVYRGLAARWVWQSGPELIVAKTPDSIDVVAGQPARVTTVFAGGRGVRRPQTPSDGAVIEWQRSDNNGLAWRPVARSYEQDADPWPQGGRGTILPFAYWGVSYDFVASAADQGALIRTQACYTPPAGSTLNTPPCIFSTPTRINLLQQAAAPAFTTAPSSVLVRAGEAARFAAEVTGLPAPTLRWEFRSPGSTGTWTPVPGATGSSLTTAPLALADSGTLYRLVATNAAGTLTSGPVTAFVSEGDVAPTITTQPANITVTSGNDALFAVAVRGTETLSYEWRRNGTPIGGASGPVLRLAAVDSNAAGDYTVVVTNAAGTATSNAARLTVQAAGNPTISPPSIVTAPVNVTVNAGNTATFAVGVAGTAPFSYQWRKNGQPINGATQAFYSIAAAASGDAGTYSVTVTNSAGAVTSTAASLTVNPSAQPQPVVITAQPSPQVQAPGSGATFAVAATGTGPFTYQWFKDGQPLNGATDAVLVLTNITGSDAGSYAVVVSNGVSTVTSNAASLIVLGVPAITTQPANAVVAEGQSATFSVTATGTSLRYQWTRNGVGIVGATSSSYSTPALTVADSGAVYAVIVYNGAGIVFSAPATLAVTAAPPPPGWSAATTVVAANDSESAAAGIDSARNTLALWVRYESARGRIYAARGSVAGAWGTGARIDDALPANADSFEPQIAVAPGGSAVAVWGFGLRGTVEYHVAAARFNGTSWSAAEQLDVMSGQSSGHRVGTAANGRAIAIWRQFNGSRRAIYARIHDGSAWSAPQLIDGGSNTGDPELAVDAQGRGWVLMTDTGAVKAAQVDLATGSIGAPITVATGRAMYSIRVAADAGGGAVAAWVEDIPSGGYDLRAARFASGTWAAAETLAVNVPFNQDLAAAAGGSGQAVVAWRGRDSGGNDAVFARVLSGGTWAAASRASPVGARNPQAVQVAMSPAGRIVLHWAQRDATDTFLQAWAQVYDGGTWAAAQGVQPGPAQMLAQTLPIALRSVAVGSDGAALLLWTEQTGALLGAYYR